jgi:uncharacterized membrane protein
MTPPPKDPADAAAAAIAELRETIRDAHGTRRDLIAATREARAEAAAQLAGPVADRIQAEVTARLTVLEATIAAAVDEAVAKVLDGFDRFGEALLGTEVYWATAAGRKATAPRPDAAVIPPLGGDS